MIFNDIDQISTVNLPREEAKDMDYCLRVGRDRILKDGVESLRACEDYKTTHAQPPIFDISNNRPFTDAVLCPSHYDWDEAQSAAIEVLCEKYRVIEVADDEIRELRLSTLNNLSQGDAVRKILHQKSGIVEVVQQAIQKAKDFDFQDAEDEAEEESNLQLSSYLNVKEAVYCSRRRSTLYFV